MTERFLVASSLAGAAAMAEKEWGWKRIGPSRWQDHEGQEVEYIFDGSAHELQGGIYLGHHWQKRDDAFVIDRNVRATLFHVLIPPKASLMG